MPRRSSALCHRAVIGMLARRRKTKMSTDTAVERRASRHIASRRSAAGQGLEHVAIFVDQLGGLRTAPAGQGDDSDAKAVCSREVV
jgi:hypothetical protein